MRERNYLFEGASVFDYQRHFAESALRDVENMSEDEILSRSTEDLIQGLKDKYSFNFPIIHDEHTELDEETVEQEIRGDYDYHFDSRGGTQTIKVKRAIFHVPFEGDARMFDIGPSNRSIPGPCAKVLPTQLLIVIGVDRLTPEQVKSAFLDTIASIKRHLEQMRRDLANVHLHFEDPARLKVEQRRANILRNKNTLAALGFPMKRRADAPATYRAPEVRKKINPVRVATVKTDPFKPEPVLEEAEYTHILNVMDNMTKVMERSPLSFAQMGEEDIRQHFLVQLNAQYEGQATGETFNFQGKTDIFIHSEGRSIFIAECKIWRGEKVFLETLDQILSYLSWRDTKTAVVIFNRNKDMSGVLTTIRSAIEKHPHKKRGPDIQGETRFRYIMGNPSDHNREVIMTVMVYDIPAPKV